MVKRYNNADVQQTIGAACAGTVVRHVLYGVRRPTGQLDDTAVTSASGNWRGPESAESAVGDGRLPQR